MLLGGDGVLWEIHRPVLSFYVLGYELDGFAMLYAASPQGQSNMVIGHGLG